MTYKVVAKSAIEIVAEFGPFDSMADAKEQAQDLADMMEAREDLDVYVLDPSAQQEMGLQGPVPAHEGAELEQYGPEPQQYGPEPYQPDHHYDSDGFRVDDVQYDEILDNPSKFALVGQRGFDDEILKVHKTREAAQREWDKKYDTGMIGPRVRIVEVGPDAPHELITVQGRKTIRMRNPEQWLQEADQEIEDDGTEGAFTKQARRAGYKNTMEFARKVMAGWRSGKKTVLNKKTRKQQGITKKTMARANFAINAQKRRNPTGHMAHITAVHRNSYPMSEGDVRVVIDALSGQMGMVSIGHLAARTGLPIQTVFHALRDRLGYGVEETDTGLSDWYIVRRNPAPLSFRFDGPGGQAGSVRFRKGPVGKVGRIDVSVTPTNTFHAYLYEDAPNWVLLKDYIGVFKADGGSVPYETKVKVYKAAQKALEDYTGLPATPRARPRRKGEG